MKGLAFADFAVRISMPSGMNSYRKINTVTCDQKTITPITVAAIAVMSTAPPLRHLSRRAQSDENSATRRQLGIQKRYLALLLSTRSR